MAASAFKTRRALAMGVVDGTENPISNFWTQRMHEVQTHLSLTHHGYLGYAVVVHQRFWANLAGPDRQLVAAALEEALAQVDAEVEDAIAFAATALLRHRGRALTLIAAVKIGRAHV